jgi:hypothetical protein
MTRTIVGVGLVLLAVTAAGCGSSDGAEGDPTGAIESAASVTLAFSPASHAFGTVAPGASATATFTLTNSGKAKSGAITLGLTGALSDFHVASTTCGASLASKASCTVSVAFAPPVGAAAGAQSATLTASSASGAKAHASLTGTVAAMHSIGGAVSGLQGSGLTLSDGVDVLTVAPGATAFAFPTKLASGAAYAVAVSAQPSNPSQTCTVSNGTGTVGTADVTNVQVSCTTATYPLSITVYNGTCSGGYCGLQCATIPLTLSGSASASIDAAGSYTSTGATYVFPGHSSVLAGSTVDVQYAAPAGTFCTCSFDPNNVHAECASWGCPMTVVPQETVNGAIHATLYCSYPIL